ncbi:MAG: hypothetical protein KatS3mg043_1266 [Rhodothermaceae bacterium]|nr:MAG: hypothetical protein KatS3mg043_1266 [Rhodothermaceae bacterium]
MARARRSTGCTAVGLFVLVGLTASCELADTREEPCSGADGLQEVHAELLACAGWLDFVTANVCTVEYTLAIPATRQNIHVLGRTFCAEGRILVATAGPRKGLNLPPLSPVEVVTTIVHEAAHLADACLNGEPPALAAEEAFREDLCAAFAAGKPGCRAARDYCPASAKP